MTKQVLILILLSTTVAHAGATWRQNVRTFEDRQGRITTFDHPVAWGLGGLSGLDDGAGLFVDPNGFVASDVDNFFYDDATNTLDVNGLTITGTRTIGLDMSGGTFATAIQKWPAGTIATTGTTIFQPAADSTTAYQWLDADGGTPVLNVDTVTELVGIRTASPSDPLTVVGNIGIRVSGETNLIMNNATSQWKLYQPAGSSDIRLYQGADKFTFKTDGNLLLSLSGGVEFGSTSDNLRVDNTFKQLGFAVNAATASGGQLILGSLSLQARDYDHAPPTNPTFFIHSVTDPDSANDEWVSFSHDQTNAVFGLGSGAYTFPDGLVILPNLTATRLVSTGASSELASTDLNSWVAGTANEINIADDGDGTITIGIVDPLIVAKGGTGLATITDGGLLLGSGTGAITPLAQATNGQLPIGSTGADPTLATLTGTANQITVTNGAGSITLATPQDIHTAATPTFAGLTITGSSVHALNSAIFQPTTDQTDYFKIMDTDGGTAIFQVDTVNEVIGIKAAPSVNADITVRSTHSLTTADQLGIDLIVDQDTATANRIIGYRAAATSSHSSGTVPFVIGFETAASPKSNSAVTQAWGALMGAASEPGATPAITVLAGGAGQNGINEAAVSFSFTFYGLATTIGAGSCSSAVGFYGSTQTVGSAQNLSFLSQGDSLIASDSKLYFEGTIGTTGDTYLTYDSAGTTLDFFVNATEVINANTTTVTVPVTTHLGGAANYVNIEPDGDVDFKGDSGLAFGSFYGNEIAFVVAGGTGTYSIITDADIAVSQINNTVFQNNQELDIGAYAGKYLVTWSMSVKGTGANKHLVGAIGVDVGGVTGDVAQNPGRNHGVTVGAAEVPLSGSTHLDLSANDEVSLMITNETDNTNVTVEHVNLTITQVGGT